MSPAPIAITAAAMTGRRDRRGFRARWGTGTCGGTHFYRTRKQVMARDAGCRGKASRRVVRLEGNDWTDQTASSAHGPPVPARGLEAAAGMRHHEDGAGPERMAPNCLSHPLGRVVLVPGRTSTVPGGRDRDEASGATADQLRRLPRRVRQLLGGILHGRAGGSGGTARWRGRGGRQGRVHSAEPAARLAGVVAVSAVQRVSGSLGRGGRSRG